MKWLLGSVLALAIVSAIQAKLNCDEKTAKVPKEWLDMSEGCIGEVRRQIQEEIAASLQYLAMGAHFAKDTVNRPGFSELFFKAAGEEREHATKLIEYLLMRGELTTGVSDLITFKAPEKSSWSTGVDALRDALIKETHVTESIHKVIKKCENDKSKNDYHLVDYLTGDFLQEQYHGQRDLAGKISTLDKLMEMHGPLGEFLFDKKLLD